jgi:hypothetical protein
MESALLIGSSQENNKMKTFQISKTQKTESQIDGGKRISDFPELSCNGLPFAMQAGG